MTTDHTEYTDGKGKTNYEDNERLKCFPRLSPEGAPYLSPGRSPGCEIRPERRVAVGEEPE